MRDTEIGQAEELAKKLRAGNYGWGHAKQELFEVLDAQLAPFRQGYVELRSDEKRLDAILAEGADNARVVARRTMRRVREAIGIDRAVALDEPKTVRIRISDIPVIAPGETKKN